MKCAIIDLDSVIFTAGHPNKQLDENGFPMRTEDDKKFLYIEKSADELIESARELMISILTKSGATHYIAFVKGSNTLKGRKDINPEYKANRKLESPVWFNFLKDYYITQWKAVEVNDMEVDDAVNISYLNTKDSFRCAIDKDLLSLQGTNYNWSKNEWIENTYVQEERYFWTSMITGDTIDNIRGIPGKGIKYAEKLFNVSPEISTDLMCKVLIAYVSEFANRDIGIKEFSKNYFSLKILDGFPGFVCPEIIEFNLNEYKETNNREKWD